MAKKVKKRKKTYIEKLYKLRKNPCDLIIASARENRYQKDTDTEQFRLLDEAFRNILAWEGVEGVAKYAVFVAEVYEDEGAQNPYCGGN